MRGFLSVVSDSLGKAFKLNFLNSIPSRSSFSRSSTGTYISSNSPAISTAAINIPRFEKDITSGADKGLLLEDAATNSFLQSADLSSASWIKLSATVTPNVATAPDGTLSADRINFAGNPSTWDIIYQGLYTGSYVWSGWMRTEDGSTKTVYVSYGVPNAAKRVAFTVTGTWKRFEAAITPSGENVHLGNQDSLTPAGWTTFSILAWGLQLEASPTRTSYIPTATTVATRQADQLSINVPYGNYKITRVNSTGTSTLLNVPVSGPYLVNNQSSSNLSSLTFEKLGYDIDSRNWFDAIFQNGGNITEQAKVIFDEMIRGLKSDGVWTNITEMGAFFGLEDIYSTQVKIKWNSSAASSRIMTNVGLSPTDYIKSGPNLGIRGGVNSKYINTNINISNLIPTNFSMGVAVAPVVTSATNIFMGSSYAATGDTNRLYIGYVGSTSVNSDFGNGGGFIATLTEGMYASSLSSGTNALYKDGVNTGSVAYNNSGFNSGNIFILNGAGTLPSLTPVRFYFIGSNSVNHALLYQRINTAISKFKSI